MRRLAPCIAAILGVCLVPATSGFGGAPNSLQVRVPQTSGSQAAEPQTSASAAGPASGAGLFNSHCGICHFRMGPGTIMLERRLGADHALLDERLDLDPDYVKTVVRGGIGGMPPQTRVDLTNAELDAVVAYLTRPASDRTQPHGLPQRTTP